MEQSRIRVWAASEARLPEGVKLRAEHGEGEMAKHLPDILMCGKQQSGIAIGRLCDNCDGMQECSYNAYPGFCDVICLGRRREQIEEHSELGFCVPGVIGMYAFDV